MRIRAPINVARTDIPPGLYYLALGVLFRTDSSRPRIVSRRIKAAVIDTGNATTSISGYDARRLHIDVKKLDPSGYSDVMGDTLKSYTMRDVLFVLPSIRGKPDYIFLRNVDVLQLEPGATRTYHVPTLIGLDILSRYTLHLEPAACHLTRPGR